MKPWEPWLRAVAEMCSMRAWNFIYANPWYLACAQMQQRDFEEWRVNRETH